MIEKNNEPHPFPWVFGMLMNPIVLNPIEESGPELDPHKDR